MRLVLAVIGYGIIYVLSKIYPAEIGYPETDWFDLEPTGRNN